jgi:hypothetical protein
MANTYVKIGSTVTVGVLGSSTIDFTSIPATYTDFVVKVSARGTTTEALGGHYYAIALNGSATSKTQRFLQGDGSSASSGNSTSFTTYMCPSDFTASTFSNSEIYLPNYAGSNNKSMSVDIVTENNATKSYAAFYAQLWSNTAAITQITLTANAGLFAQYSTATLYGISKS